MGTVSADDTHERRVTLVELINEFRDKGKLVNRYTLKPALEQKGFNVSYATVYRDMTVINQKNTWVRDLAQSNYSAYQEQISQTLDWIETKAAQAFHETQNHVWLNIIHKVQETKMKHTHGDNINISAALLSKKFNQYQQERTQEEERKRQDYVDVRKLADSR